MVHPLDILNHPIHYRRMFLDLELWQPFVAEVCQRHRFGSCRVIRTGIPGTYPTFLVENRLVIKFYGSLFDGGRSFEVERAVNHLLRTEPSIPTPALIAEGELQPLGASWNWPFLVWEYIPGVSFGEVFGLFDESEKLQIARSVGILLRRLHNLAVPSGSVFGNGWESYWQFLEERRLACPADHRRWNSLPGHLVEEIEAFLPPVDHLFDREIAPHLIHADLTRDHLLGEVEAGRWSTKGLIDFGDAMTGGLLYELAALHLDLFGGETRLLWTFLETYGLEKGEWIDLPEKALAVALIHRFDVFSGAFERHPEWKQARSLCELASAVYGLERMR